MNAHTERFTIAGPAGPLACALDAPAAADGAAPARGLALICHPHPLHGGTLDNKVVQTLARAAVQAGLRALRFNFRGVGGSAGKWDEGRGEIDDAAAVLAYGLRAGEPFWLAGFSFGAHVASQLAQRQAQAGSPAERLVLVGPAVSNFEVAPVPAGSRVVHGELDDVVALAAVLDWARPQQQPVLVMPGAGHFFHGLLPQLKAAVADAFHVATEVS
jgi:uncharacterized protein